MVDIETANVTPVGNWDMTGGDVKVPAPSVDTDASTKKYVDDVGGITASSTDTLTNKTINDFSNKVDADEIHIKIRNESGSTMTKGQLVYISGYSVGEDVPLVTLADASASSTMPMLAMINDADIANNATGHATMSGRVFNIDTSAFTAGDTAYVSVTAGALSTRPSGTSDKVQAIGIILRSHASNGIIQIIGAGRVNDITNDIDHATDLQNIGTNAHSVIDTHLANTSDPHSVTASQVGLGNVSNVSTDDTAYNSTSWNTNTDSATKNAIRDKVETMDTAISSNTSASHAQSHNIASHSDTTATGEELNTLTGGTDTTLHDHDGISENTTHRGSDGSDHSAVVTNTSKVSYTKTNVKATINHGGTSGTSRPSGFDSVEWIGTVEPTNAANDDTWIDTT